MVVIKERVGRLDIYLPTLIKIFLSDSKAKNCKNYKTSTSTSSLQSHSGVAALHPQHKSNHMDWLLTALPLHCIVFSCIKWDSRVRRLIRLMDRGLIWYQDQFAVHSCSSSSSSRGGALLFSLPSTKGNRAELCPCRHLAGPGCRKLITGLHQNLNRQFQAALPFLFRPGTQTMAREERHRQRGRGGEGERALASGRCPIHPTEDTLLQLNGPLAYTGPGC